MKPTYDHAVVKVGANIAKRTGLNALSSKGVNLLSELDQSLKEKVPVLVFLHGCGGLFYETRQLLSIIHQLTPDFVIVAPDSFARDRPQVCTNGYTVSSLYSESAGWRDMELRYTLSQLQKMASVDQDNIFVFGHSQGGGTSFGYDGDVPVKGRVSHSGGCYDGSTSRTITSNGTGSSDAVLSFHSPNDPWFKGKSYVTLCEHFARSHPNGTAISDDTPSHYRIVSAYGVNAKAFKDWIYGVWRK